MKKSFEIADLIVAFIKGEISTEDLSVLDAWLEQAEENRALFVSFMDEAVFGKEKQGFAPEHLDEVFARIKDRKRQIRRKRQLGIWSTVAACITVFLAVWMFLQPQEEIPVAENATISVGKQMAYLLLSSGEKIVLQEHQQDTITVKEAHRQIILSHGRLEIEEHQPDSVAEQEYHTLEIPRGAEYHLTLPDGTQVWMNAESKLRFPTCFSDNRRYVELSGEAYFQVSRDEARPFIVHTDEVDVRVLGTEFCIRNYAGKPALTTLVRGSVEVTDQQGEQVILEPNQQAVTTMAGTTVRKVEPLYYTSWKDGYFIFDNAPLREIMEDLSLWYNCQYFFLNQSAADLRMTARLKKYDEIDVLLKILSKTNEIEIEKKGTAIVIRQK